MDSWLSKYIPPAVAADATAVAPHNPAPMQQNVIRPDTVNPNMPDAVTGRGAFMPGSSNVASLNEFLNPMRAGARAHQLLNAGHPVMAGAEALGALGPAAAELSGPTRSLLARILAGGGAEGGELAAHAPTSPGYNWLREGHAQGAIPDGAARHPQMMNAVADSVAGRVAGFVPQGPATALPGSDYAQLLQQTRRANVGEPLPVAPRPAPPVVAPANIPGMTRDIDQSLFTRQPAYSAPAASLPALSKFEQSRMGMLQALGYSPEEAEANVRTMSKKAGR